MQTFFRFYNCIAIKPTINPNILPIALILPLYNLLDSGISSPDTIYNIAPAAKLRHIAITCSDIDPTIAPKNAPIPVVIPDSITYNIIFSLYSFTQMIFDCKIQDMIYYHKDFIYIIFILQINNITLYL